MGFSWANASLDWDDDSLVFVGKELDNTGCPQMSVGSADDDSEEMFFDAEGSSQLDMDSSLGGARNGFFQTAKTFATGFVRTLAPWSAVEGDPADDFDVINVTRDGFSGQIIDFPGNEDESRIEESWWKRLAKWTTTNLTECYLIDKHTRLLATVGVFVAGSIAFSPVLLTGLPLSTYLHTMGYAAVPVALLIDYVPGGEGMVKRQLFRLSDATKDFFRNFR